MKISFAKYPVDIILCILWSLIIIPIALLDIEEILRIILGLPFVLFIPGYILVFTLFPTRKTDRGIDIIERVALSFGLSIAIVPLIGLGLNYTPLGIRLEPILLSIFIFIISVGSIGVYRWLKTTPDERFTFSLDISLPKSESNLNKALTILLIAMIIITIASLIYVVINPKTGEQFTEFYILSSEGTAEEYPRYIHVGENAEGTIGIVNHEHKTVKYTIEIWLVNQTSTYNETEQKNHTTIHNMWFVDRITTSLEHSPVDVEQSWASQWEEKFSVPINQTGSFKLIFLLFTTPTENYTINKDYKNIAVEKIESAYRELYLWIDIPYTTFYLQVNNGTAETHYRNITIEENVTGITGLVNHEHKTVNYTVEIWLLNQTNTYNQTEQKNHTTIHNMWFVDKITTSLEHVPIDFEKPWTSQWEEKFSVPINQTGSFKLLFLLFTTPTDIYNINEDYNSIAEEKIKGAYLELYLIINVEDTFS